LLKMKKIEDGFTAGLKAFLDSKASAEQSLSKLIADGLALLD